MPEFVSSTVGSTAWAKKPDSWLDIYKFDDTIKRWGVHALSDTGRFVEPRLKEVSSIERKSSDKDGNYTPSRLRVLADDGDADVRTELADPRTRNYLNCFAIYNLLSREGRKTDLDSRSMFKGRVTNMQPVIGRGTMIEMLDIIGAYKGILDPERKVGVLIGDEWSNKPPETNGRIYPIYFGIYNDLKRTDINGEPADKGVCPGIDVGDTFVPGTSPDPTGRGFNSNQARVLDQAANNVVGGGSIPAGTTVWMIVAPIDADGNIGPGSFPLFLSPDANIAMKASWKKSVDNPPQYAVFLVNNPNFDPVANPTGASIIRYFVQDATDLNGEFIGTTQWDYTRTFTSLSDGAQWGIQKASPPSNIRATVVGATGTTVRRYALTSISPLGESIISEVITVNNGPAILSSTDYISLQWDLPTEGGDGISGYRVVVLNSPQTNTNGQPNQSIAVLDISQQMFIDDGSASLQPFNAPMSNGALVGEDAPWGIFVIAQGQVEIMDVYGSDVAEGEKPARSKITTSENIAFSGSDNWPYAEPTITVQNSAGQNIECTCILARGEVLRAHRAKDVTIAVNLCGYTDPNGLVIDQAFKMLLAFHNDIIELNNGEGYLSGQVGSFPIELFPDGKPKFWTSRYEDAQAATIDRIGGLGYVGRLFVEKQMTLNEVHRRFFSSYGGHYTSDNNGRIYPYVLFGANPFHTGKLYRERMEIKRLENHEFDYSELENRGSYRYLYDIDTQQFTSPDVKFEDTAAIDELGGERLGVYQKDVHQCFFADNEDTIADRWEWELELYSLPARYATWATDLQGTEHFNGDPVRFTHRKEGIGPDGDIETAGAIKETIFRPKAKTQEYEIVHKVRLFDNPVA